MGKRYRNTWWAHVITDEYIIDDLGDAVGQEEFWGTVGVDAKIKNFVFCVN